MILTLPKFYPTNSLLASFGKSQSDKRTLPAATNFLVKELRLWNR